MADLQLNPPNTSPDKENAAERWVPAPAFLMHNCSDVYQPIDCLVYGRLHGYQKDNVIFYNLLLQVSKMSSPLEWKEHLHKMWQCPLSKLVTIEGESASK